MPTMSTATAPRYCDNTSSASAAAQRESDSMPEFGDVVDTVTWGTATKSQLTTRGCVIRTSMPAMKAILNHAQVWLPKDIASQAQGSTSTYKVAAGSVGLVAFMALDYVDIWRPAQPVAQTLVASSNRMRAHLKHLGREGLLPVPQVGPPAAKILAGLPRAG